MNYQGALRPGDAVDGWCILRTAGPSTMKLAKSLQAAGFEVWTPTQTVRIRVPRSKRMVEKSSAILPTFVFARAQHLADLLRAHAMPDGAHPRFHLMRQDGGVAGIMDRELDRLRAAEDRARRQALKRKRSTVAKGDHVRVEEGAYAGLRGVVDRVGAQFAKVSIGGKSMQIATFLLLPDDLSSGFDRPLANAA